MNIGVLGTGSVGNAIATKLIELGHAVTMGSRTANNERAAGWAAANGERASHGTFENAVSKADMIFLCLNGSGTIDALNMAGVENFKNKTVVDITNPLDFSKGMPPTLFTAGGVSLGEEVQRNLPDAQVVKTLNIVTAHVMVNPLLIPGEPDMLLCGNESGAKEKVSKLLADFGWKNVIDLGSIESARNMEGFVLLWVNLFQKFGSPDFAIKFLKP